jgi:uncharacterized protein (DUF1330 family)
MKYYAVAQIDVTDQSWIPAYVETVTKLVERHGGKYLARTNRVQKIEGDRNPPQILVIIEWPSEAAAKAFYESEEYRPHRQARIDGARNFFLLAPGEDIARMAQSAS